MTTASDSIFSVQLDSVSVLPAGFPARKTRSSLRRSTTTTVRLSAYDVIMQMVYCIQCNYYLTCRFQVDIMRLGEYIHNVLFKQFLFIERAISANKLYGVNRQMSDCLNFTFNHGPTTGRILPSTGNQD